ncbi:PIG-L deacetylase family protein [Candidatus Magnetaquicoccus inordinatus]|uniref:PIG-L deacetylase family protein n=1 Tax=Candidatus Magnetaquicoccus inordinatus TaxID=2496818 RepID=UPI00102C9A9B|nr:PIG-L deacetylase family protein [Candidatus Magnetaquicoccus inordinatus]
MARKRSLKDRLQSWLFTRRSYRFLIRDWQTLTDLPLAAQALNTLRFSRNLQPVEATGLPGQRILVLAPHPDDELLGPGGALLQSRAQGATITVLYLTSGLPHEREIREAEAREVARLCDFNSHFLRWPDGALPADQEALQQLAAAISAVNPDLLLLPSLFDDHDDHRRCSELLWRLSTQQLLPATLDVWAYQVYSAVLGNVVIDITAVSTSKAEAIRCYRSQMQQRDWAHFALGLNAWNCRFLKKSAHAAAYAEMFLTLPLHEYAALCRPYFADSRTAYYAAAYQNSSL